MEDIFLKFLSQASSGGISVEGAYSIVAGTNLGTTATGYKTYPYWHLFLKNILTDTFLKNILVGTFLRNIRACTF